jgi:hypothetical protein
MAWDTTQVDYVDNINAAEWNTMVTAIKNQGGSFYIYKTGGTCYAKNMATAATVAADTNDRVVFNSVRSALVSGGYALIAPGSYTLDATGGTSYSFYNNMGLLGEDKNRTILNMIGCEFYIYNKSNVFIKNLTLTGGYGINMQHVGTSQSGFLFEDLEISTESNTGIYCYAQNGQLSRLRINKVFFNECGYHGIQLNGAGSPKLLKDVWITDCYAYKCGWDGTWSVGFDLGEQCDVDTMYVHNCTAEMSWESGFHFEGGNSYNRIIVSDCISKYNGQKPSPTYAAGFLIPKGAIIINCLSVENTRLGFGGGCSTVLGAADRDVIFENCTDIGSPTGFSFHDWHGVGRLIGRGLLSIEAAQPLYAVSGENFDIELTARNTTTSSDVFSCIFSSIAYPIINSRLKVDFSNFTTETAVARAIYISGARNVSFEGNIQTTQSYGAYTLGNPNLIIQNMHINGPYMEAIHGESASNNVFVRNTLIENTTTGALVNGIRSPAGAITVETKTVRILNATTQYAGALYSDLNAYGYYVYKVGSNYYAVNKGTSGITTSGSEFGSVVNACINTFTTTGEVELGPGEFVMTTVPIDIAGKSINLHGQGAGNGNLWTNWGTAIRCGSGFTDFCVKNTSSVNALQSIKISDIYFNGNGYHGPLGAIYLSDSWNGRIVNCAFTSFRKNVLDDGGTINATAIFLEERNHDVGCYYNIIDNPYMSSNTIGVRFGFNANANMILGGVIGGSGTAYAGGDIQYGVICDDAGTNVIYGTDICGFATTAGGGASVAFWSKYERYGGSNAKLIGTRFEENNCHVKISSGGGYCKFIACSFAGTNIHGTYTIEAGGGYNTFTDCVMDITGGVTDNNTGLSKTIFTNCPGYKTFYKGAATFTSGSAAATVTHNLNVTPTTVVVSGTSSDTVNLWVTSINSSNFTIKSGIDVEGLRTVYWEAMG